MQKTQTICSNVICVQHRDILQGQALRDLASAAIDISDGLISDLGHIVNACGCGARVNVACVAILRRAFAQHVEPEQALLLGALGR